MLWDCSAIKGKAFCDLYEWDNLRVPSRTRDWAYAHSKNISISTKTDSSVLAMYFARKQDVLQRAVASSDPPVPKLEH